MITLEIINHISGKGANKVHAFNPKGLEDEDDYVELAAVIRNENGEALKDKIVIITATDSSQNRTYNETGVIRRIFRNGERRHTPIYPFHYEFKSEGKHTITFTCEGVSQSVELQVLKKKPKDKKDK